MRCPGHFVRIPNVAFIFGTRSDIEAQRRFQKKLWQAARRLPLSTLDQRRTRPFLRLAGLLARARFDDDDLVEALVPATRRVSGAKLRDAGYERIERNFRYLTSAASIGARK